MEPQKQAFEFDDVRVDARNAQVTKAGQRLALEPKAFRVLVYLLERPGQLVEKEELISAIWAGTFVTENALTRAIALLRKVLGDSSSEAKYIETVPTRGYRFIAKVSVFEGADGSESAPAITPGSTATHTAPQKGRSWWRHPIVWIATTVSVALVLAAASWFALTPQKTFDLPDDFHTLQVTNSKALDAFPSFSPDGNTLAYSSNESGSFEIYLKQLTWGGRLIQLTNDGMRNLEPAWSPDGTTIAYYSQTRGGIWAVSALGGVPRQLTTFGSSPAWSPDGKQIVFQSTGIRDLNATSVAAFVNSSLWIVSPEGGTPRQLTQRDKPPGAHNSPTWSPDGKRIAFTSASLDFQTSLWTVSPDGTALKSVGTSWGLFEPVYAHDGRNVIASTGHGLFEISLTQPAKDANPEHQRLFSSLPEAIRHTAVSPDGRRIAFSRVKSTSDIYSLPMSGDHASASPVALTQDTRMRKTTPRVSPDGRRILFDVGALDRSGGIWVMDSDGKNANLVQAPCGNPQWLPGNQDFICVGSSKDPDPKCTSESCYSTDILKVHLPTGTWERIRHMDQDAGFISLSVDGKQLAFTSLKGGHPNVWIVSLVGEPQRQITFDPESMGFPSWAPDGRSLVVEQQRGDDTYMYIVKPGDAPVQLTRAPGQNWPHSWSPDGEKIAFAACRDGVWNVWWVSRRDGSEKQLTNYIGLNHYVRYPAWSPTGNAIVYEYSETSGNIWMLEKTK